MIKPLQRPLLIPPVIIPNTYGAVNKYKSRGDYGSDGNYRETRVVDGRLIFEEDEGADEVACITSVSHDQGI
jgi:hypothetical protein